MTNLVNEKFLPQREKGVYPFSSGKRRQQPKVCPNELLQRSRPAADRFSR
jgi:hypothetical protein